MRRKLQKVATAPVKVAGLEIRYVDISSLKPDPKNTRTHDERQVALLAEAIKQFGWTNPLIVHKGKVVAGHGRLMAAKLLGITKVPIIDRSDMSEDQRRAYVIADNRLAELAGWDRSLLRAELGELAMLKNFDIKLTGFDMTFLDPKLAKVKANEEEEDLTEVKQFSNEVRFPGEGDFGFPQLLKKKDTLLDVAKLPEIATWGGKGSEDRGKPLWLYTFGTDETVGLDWTKTIIGFYTDDEKFESIWNDTAEHVGKMARRGVYGCITPNFSTYPQWSRAECLYNIYRSRFVARYMQGAGLKIVPDFNATPRDVDDAAKGLRGFPSIAIQRQQGYSSDKELEADRAMLKYALDIIKPESILFYAPGDRLKLYPFLTKYHILLVEPRMAVRARRMKEAKRKEK